MISGANMLFKDAIIVLNMFLSIGKIGHEGPSTILEDLKNWLEFMSGIDFCDLEAGLLIKFNTYSTRDVIVGAVQSATNIAV